MEAYNHVFDRDEKRSLAQAATNVMHRRPRIDFSADYFVKSYRLDCSVVRKQAGLIKSMLDNHVSFFVPSCAFVPRRVDLGVS